VVGEAGGNNTIAERISTACNLVFGSWVIGTVARVQASILRASLDAAVNMSPRQSDGPREQSCGRV
jgi:hypothetical protein